MVKKIFFSLLILSLLIIYTYFFFLGGYQYLQLSALQSWRAEINNFYLASPFKVIFIYFFLYVILTGVGLPIAGVLSLFGGFLFGLVKGVVLVSFASSTGALLAFALARLLFSFIKRALKNTRLGKIQKSGAVVKAVHTIQKKIKTEGIWYLLTLRLVPLFPFFIVNIAMGLTPIKARTFFWVSQLGMFPATLLYVNAGARLSEIESVRDIMSFPVFASFTLLGLFPIVAKTIYKQIRKKL